MASSNQRPMSPTTVKGVECYSSHFEYHEQLDHCILTKVNIATYRNLGRRSDELTLCSYPAVHSVHVFVGEYVLSCAKKLATRYTTHLMKLCTTANDDSLLVGFRAGWLVHDQMLIGMVSYGCLCLC